MLCVTSTPIFRSRTSNGPFSAGLLRMSFNQAAQQKAAKARKIEDSLPSTLPTKKAGEAPSIPIGAFPNGVTEGTSVAFICGNLADEV